jgi:uncharacterized protein YfiM (DUF2279 family)
MQLCVSRYEQHVFGLPDRAIVFTNTERNTAACARRYWFAEVEGLRPKVAARPLRYGAAWGTLLDDLHTYWMKFDSEYPVDAVHRCVWCAGCGAIADERCARCAGSGLGPVARALREWERIEREHGKSDDFDPAEEAQTLTRCWEGYVLEYGRKPLDDYRVVGVEVAFAAPVINPSTGNPYSPVTWLVRTPEGMRVARTGEARSEHAVSVRWPYYQIGKLDALYQHRVTGDLWVWEGKSSKDPAGYMQGVSVDPQIGGYVWLVEHHLKEFPGATRVAGFMYDIVSSVKHGDPKPLAAAKVPVLDEEGKPLMKGKRQVWQVDADGEPVLRCPGLSRAAGTIPSWRYRAALAKHGFDEKDYIDHLDKLEAEIDPKLYLRDFGTVGREPVARYAREVFAICGSLSAMRRAAATSTSPNDLDVAFPRTAICRLPGGRCPYRGPCLEDGPLVRQNFETSTSVRWTEQQPTIAPPPADDLGEELGW